jgi:hypothetical protein
MVHKQAHSIWADLLSDIDSTANRRTLTGKHSPGLQRIQPIWETRNKVHTA